MNLGEVAVIPRCSSSVDNHVFSFNPLLALFQQFEPSGRSEEEATYAPDEIFWFRRQCSRPVAFGIGLVSSATDSGAYSCGHK
jgi:hypothetical protein